MSEARLSRKVCIAHSETASAPQKARRRSQADKSADTRNRLVLAAVQCLHARGYAMVTTEQVLRASGVSRGAMLHQYPTKTDLMLGVVKTVWEDDVRVFQERLAAALPLEGILRLPELIWERHRRPEAIAALEIMLASRSNAVLSAGLIPLRSALEQQTNEQIEEAMRDAGLELGLQGALLLRTINAAIRGLAIELIFAEDRELVEQTAGHLRTLLQSHLRQCAE